MKRQRIIFFTVLLPLLFVTGVDSGAQAREAKGTFPTAAIVAHGDVWVTNGSGRLIRVDATHRKILTTTRLGNFASSVTAAGGFVWVAVDGTLFRVELTTGRAHLVRGPSGVTYLTSGGGDLWLGLTTNVLVRFDPRLGQPKERIPVRGRLLGLTGGRNGIFVESTPAHGPVTGPAGPRVISKVGTRRRLHVVSRTNCDTSMTVANDVLWLLDLCTGSLRRLDLKSERVVRVASVDRNQNLLTAGFGAVWLGGPRSVVRVNAASGRIEARLAVESAAALAVSTRGVWIITAMPPRALFLDPMRNALSGTTVPLRSP